MTRCSRCGMGWCNVTAAGFPHDSLVAALACRDRELENLRALKLSLTKKLDDAWDYLADINNPAAAISARLLIETVLEEIGDGTHSEACKALSEHFERSK